MVSVRKYLGDVKRETKSKSIFLQEFDWLYAACSMQPRSLTIEELPPELPCDQVYWEASTAFAWSAHNPWSDSPPLRHSVSGYLQVLDNDSPMLEPLTLDPLSRRLLSLYLSMICESYQQLLELPQVINSLENQILSKLQSALTRVSEKMMSLHSGVDLKHTYDMNQTIGSRSAMHFCHLSRPSRIMSLVVRAARTWASDRKTTSGSDVNNAKLESATSADQLLVSFSHAPQTAREMALHAAQILRLHRSYPSNTPHEPLLAFLAGLYLWSFAKYYAPLLNKSTGTLPVVQLDANLSETETRGSEWNEWIHHGSRAVLSNVGDLSVASAPGRVLCECAAIMKQLKVWGVAVKLLEFLIVMLRREEACVGSLQPTI